MTDQPETLVEVSPSTRPVLIKLLVVAVATAAVSVAVALGLESRSGAALVAGLGAILLLRYLVHAYILRQTTYTITTENVVRSYTFLLKQSKEVLPLSQVRGHEVTKTRSEALLGFGTVRIRAASGNRGVGFISFAHVPHPETISQRLTEYTDHLSAAESIEHQ